MAKKKCPECPSLAKWMTTFADMNCLLLTFFVLLLSMSSIDKAKIQEVVGGLLTGGRGIFDTKEEEEAARQRLLAASQASSDAVARSRDQAVQTLKSYLEAQNLQQSVSVITTSKGFTVRVMDSVLFSLGSSELLPAALPVLDRITSVAVNSSFYINIEGHTDDQPIGQFAQSNWNLSSDRALSVLKYMQRGGMPPSRLAASGYGEYHPILPNITAENRAKNRRVEINFISPEFYEANKNIFDEAIR